MRTRTLRRAQPHWPVPLGDLRIYGCVSNTALLTNFIAKVAKTSLDASPCWLASVPKHLCMVKSTQHTTTGTLGRRDRVRDRDGVISRRGHDARASEATSPKLGSISPKLRSITPELRR